MGGSGAKERRRLLRQSQASDEPVKTQIEKPRRGKKSNEGSKQIRVPTVGKKDNPKKKQVKKPKHLKRKLEALENGEAKDQLLKKLKSYEQKKADLSWHNPNGIRNLAKSQPQQLKVGLQRSSNESSAHNKRSIEKPTVISQDTSGGSSGNASDSVKQVEKKKESESTDNTSKTKVHASHGNDSSDDEGDSEPAIKRQRGKRRRGRKDTSKAVEEANSKEILVVEKPKDTRYCKGRKPVTDFEVGKYYDGKVVYAKPYGIYIDIGSHSDAFCHVSRCQDEYVESAESLYSVGDPVNVRVLEVEKSRKRITVSMQSDQMIADEQKSIEARQNRRRKSKSKQKPPVYANKLPLTPSPPNEMTQVPDALTEHVPTQKPESEMTPVELKRARKLARRAARREATGPATIETAG